MHHACLADDAVLNLQRRLDAQAVAQLAHQRRKASAHDEIFEVSRHADDFVVRHHVAQLRQHGRHVADSLAAIAQRLIDEHVLRARRVERIQHRHARRVVARLPRNARRLVAPGQLRRAGYHQHFVLRIFQQTVEALAVMFHRHLAGLGQLLGDPQARIKIILRQGYAVIPVFLHAEANRQRHHDEIGSLGFLLRKIGHGFGDDANHAFLP